MMRQPIGGRSETWPCGARTTTSPMEMIVDYRKKRTEHTPILIDRAVVEQVEVPWCPHHQQTNMVQAHQDSREEGTTKPIPPQETEKIWHRSHREHPDWLHHFLVWQLLGF